MLLGDARVLVSLFGSSKYPGLVSGRRSLRPPAPGDQTRSAVGTHILAYGAYLIAVHTLYTGCFQGARASLHALHNMVHTLHSGTGRHKHTFP